MTADAMEHGHETRGGSHHLRWPKKDLEVAMKLAQDAGVEMPFIGQCRSSWRSWVEDLAELR
ncbi:MAG: hypothetical protein GEU81_12965 [Nitriliruptorales bacterium]|nr:hypothetical protein [Nitriliruptorales bacterium]